MKLPTTNQAEKLFLQFCEAYNSRDLPALLSLLTADATVWGSGVDEYRTGLAEIEQQLRRDWSQSQQAEISVLSFVPTENEALWAAGLCQVRLLIDDQELFFDHFRGTIVIEKNQKKPKIVFMHASFPDARNPENNSFPTQTQDA